MLRLSRPFLGVVAGSLAGALAAQMISSRPAHACSCVQPTWDYTLASVEATDGASDHEPYWPTRLVLESWKGYMTLYPASAPGDHLKPEALDRLEGGAP